MPEKYHLLLRLNPAYTQIYLFQKLIYFGEVPSQGEWAAGFGVALLFFIIGMVTLVSVEDDLVFRM